MKLKVMQLLYTMSHGGAERLALTILDGSRDMVQGSVCGVFGQGGPLVEPTEALGLPHYSIDAGSVGKLKALWNLYRIFKKEQVDIVHLQAGALLVYAYLPAKLAGAKIVYTEHAKFSIQTKPKVRMLIKTLAPLTDAITTVSQDLLRFFNEYLGIPKSSMECIPNAVDTDRFTPDGGSVRGELIPEDKLIFGSVARMTEAKDHGNLLRAFKMVLDGRDDIHLALVGDGETREEVETMIAEYELQDSVLMLGRQEAIPEFLRAMDIFVLPSKREGAPISVLEAMACGIPVIATDVGGVSEIVKDRINGCVVPPEDHDSLAEAMRWMVENQDKRQALASEGLGTISADYSNTAMSERYKALYKRVVS